MRGFGGVWELDLGFEMGLDLLAYSLKAIQDGLVRKTQNLQAKTLEISCSFGIVYQTFFGKMLRAIEFNNQFTRGTIKIHDKLPNWSLPQPPLRTRIQKLIPKFFLSHSHSTTQFLRSSRQFFVVPKPSQYPKILLHSPTTKPLHGGGRHAVAGGVRC